MLIYRGEMRYLIKHKDEWQENFMSALKEYFTENESATDFIEETLELFVEDTEAPEVTELRNQLGI